MDIYNSVDKDQHVVGMYVMQMPTLILRSLDAIRHVMIKDFTVFCNRNTQANMKTDIVGSSSLLGLHYEPWKYIRTKLSPAFTNTQQKKLFSFMVVSAGHMNDHLQSQYGDKTNFTVEVRDLVTRYTTDNISSMAFGIETNSFKEKDQEFYKRGK